MNVFLKFIPDIVSLAGKDNVFVDEKMSNHTSFKVGGPVDILVTPESKEIVRELINFFKEKKIPFYVMGNGSNMLVKDGGIRGAIIKLVKLNNITLEKNKVIAESGALLSDVSDFAMNSNLTGFEFACGIPGCVGGAVAMNAGAYIGEIRDIIESALVVDTEGSCRRIYKDDLELSYRNSIILKNNYTVLEAVFELKDGIYEEIKSTVEDFQRRRREKQPLEYPSAGSTFKRPEGHYAGKLIQDAGMQGKAVGGAQVSNKHSGFIINKNNATADDILNLIELVQKNVLEMFQVKLKPEVRIMGQEKREKRKE
ncbi:UDP-N-acetylmuramate dehydrogenase [Clostridium oryzae]|uniref:UDP-N-acetylenolpyruvoylglucosamine reductase n=1 Tax=Clostridium oryzae TaxID=1450648 RepID=A0A1V4IYU7_9CLOT|nr:UDP-N-acetylmuramate dehydrogenase [Clostridium oryzae]OPJ65116.1 UDP-N-acetylenolpyruvoylglucosamine reductase [Clostridium oryzae]